MKLVIFSEAGFEYGFGHFYRMSGICEKAMSESREIELHLMADEAAKANLDREYVSFTNWQDPANYEKLLDKESTLVVDSYHVDIKQLEELQKHARDMIVIDDNIRLDYHDMKILNPNYFALCLKYPEGQNNTLYVGGDCTLLRNEFDYDGERSVSEEVSDVLITMGGTDLRGITVDVIKAIKDKSERTRLHVVCTRAYHNTDAIERLLDQKDCLYTNIDAAGMSELMKSCDFAVASAGQTTNELIKMQCPSVLIAVADNQLINTKYLSEEGYIEAVVYENKIGNAEREVIQSMFDFKKRKKISDRLKFFKTEKSGKDIVFEIAFGETDGQ